MPIWFWTTIYFIYGTIVGSFLNVCIWRMPREESVSHPPSHCPNCNRRLQPLDLVPLFSQVLLRARCRYCKAKISWRYFWVELLTGVAFVALFLRYGPEGRWVEALAGCVFTAVLIVVFFIDLEHYIIPDAPVFIGAAAGIAKDLWLIHEGVRPLWRQVPFTNILLPIPLSLISLALGAAGLLLVAWLAGLAFRQEAMGMGDVFLIGAMGANLTPPLLLLAFFLAVLIGSVVGVLLMALKLKGRRDHVPFGPFLVIGTYLVMLFGDSMIQAYLKSLGMA